jgi:hypothetical protein
MFNFNLCLKNTLPKWIDLRSGGGCPDVLDDGTMINITYISSVVNCLRYIMKYEKMKEFQISRLYVYYHLDDFNINDVLNLIINKGVYSEKDCSYDLCKIDIPKQNENLQKFDIKYMFIKNNIDNIKKYLLNNRPVIIKIPVPSNFENNPSLNLKDFTQKYKEKKFYYIYTTIYGYRNSNKSFICMHSIGKNWGERGFFYVPYKYVKKYVTEILVINNIFYI